MSTLAFDSSDDAIRDLVTELLAVAPPELGLGGPLDPTYLEEALITPAEDILRRNGKRFRSRLLEYSWVLAGGSPESLPRELPLVVELLHAGSLVIDDIEDDSDLRRGEPALHRRYGVPLALNTGNWLYFLPLALVTRLDIPDALKLELHADVSQAVLLCHQGQALDLSARVTTVRKSDMPGLVRHATMLKTGSLMRLAAVMGARAAGADAERRRAIASFGSDLGLALQMLDDWSGIANDARRHKGVEDVKLKRPTWLWAWLAEQCDELTYAKLLEEARRATIDWEIERFLLRLRSRLESSAPAFVHEHLQAAFETLEKSIEDPIGLSELAEEVARLEKAYV